MPIIEVIDFKNKTQLLDKLRLMRDSAGKLPREDRRVVKDMIGVAIQEVYFTSNREIMRFKRYVDYKKGGDNKNESK